MTTAIGHDLAPDGRSAGAWRALRDLRGAGGVAANWTDVPALLAKMDAEYLRRAGDLLARVDPDDLLARNPSVADVRVTVTGSSTLDGLRGALAAEAARHGLVVRTSLSGLGEWFADLCEPTAGGYAEPADLRLCVIDAHAVFDEVPTPWQVSDVEEALGRLLGRLTAVAQAAEQADGGVVVLNTVPLTALYAHQLIDYSSRMRLGAAWREFNIAVLRLGAECRSVLVVDLDVLVTETGPVEDPRLSAHARVHFSDEVIASYAREVVHLARALSGRTRKCLVLDLDGTLWGGVLGDDGPEGIRLGPAAGAEGEAFAAFGRVVRQLSSQGVLLAVCSKNDPGPVAAVLRDHPGSPLRDSDFVAVVASWEPKDAGIATIARRLDLGTDSFVFVDDSSFERELVRTALPGVAVVALDGDPTLHARKLLADGWFTTVELTDADRRRGEDYRTQAERRSLREACTSLSDYLAELAIEVELSPVTDADAGRVAQLTQRTNQFNLTTRRMAPADVARLVAERVALAALSAGPGPAAQPTNGLATNGLVTTGLVTTSPAATMPCPVAIRYRDRFGDLGIVGAAFLRLDGDAWHLDNLLFSCRVFGRGVESACIAGLADAARGAGARILRGYYAPTAKNARFADFYLVHGFTPVPAGATRPPGAAGTTAAFDLDLGLRLPPLAQPAVTVSARHLFDVFAAGLTAPPTRKVPLP
jgi:FkbH-like protein